MYELLASGRIRWEAIVQPVVDFNVVVEAYLYNVDEHPEEGIQFGVRFG